MGSVEKAKLIKDDIFNLINDNCDILDPINYSIIPNQLGKFRRLDQLYKDNDTFEELGNKYRFGICWNKKNING